MAGIAETLLRPINNALGTSAKNDITGLGQNEYDFTYRYFPNDLTTEQVGHYVVFNINVPVGITSGTARGAYTNQGNVPTTVLNNEYSKVDVLRFGNTGGDFGGSGPQRESLSIPRWTRRIKESIAIFMPSSMNYTTTNKYEEISLTPFVGKALGVAAGAVIGAATGFLGRAAGAAGAAGRAVDAAGRAISVGASIMKMPINPRVEVLYSHTDQRQFIFEFMMSPRNEDEATSIQNIIKTFRFHGSPEINNAQFGLGSTVGGFLGGLTLIPPADFDITFYKDGVENTNIPRINTCVLERVEMDYSPSGVYSTFSNGFPVQTRLSLAFREVELNHKLRILQGF